MKKKILTILTICSICIMCASAVYMQIKNTNERLQFKNIEINKLKEANKQITINLNKVQNENKLLNDKINKNQNDEVMQHINPYNKEITYLDTLIDGKETFTSYKNIIKNFGKPKKITKIIDKSGAYLYGYFSILIYDGIEIVVNASGNSKDHFYINEGDKVCRVDIVSDKYVFNRSYFNNLNIKVGTLASKIAETYNKKITSIDSENTFLRATVYSLRNDIENYKESKGIYFLGTNENGLCLAIVLLVDEKETVSRIIIGFPTAG